MGGVGQLLMALMSAGSPGVINQTPGWPSGTDPGGVTLSVANNGGYSVSGGSPASGTWVTPAVAEVIAYYQIKVDATSGSFSSGTTGTWLDLTSTRTWTRDAGADVEFTLSIREKATTRVRLTLTDQALIAS